MSNSVTPDSSANWPDLMHRIAAVDAQLSVARERLIALEVQDGSLREQRELVRRLEQQSFDLHEERVRLHRNRVR